MNVSLAPIITGHCSRQRRAEGWAIPVSRNRRSRLSGRALDSARTCRRDPMSNRPRFKSPLAKKASRGFRGYPAATLAFYGPNDQHATKVAVGIVPREGAEVVALERWFSTDVDIRRDPRPGQEILAFIKRHGVRAVVMPDRIIGCPHQEGVDYPEGQPCPQCPFWAHRDRWTGETLP